ncbi:hypothetical protein AALA61_14445 [Oscillospiraceae bacterium 42-9]
MAIINLRDFYPYYTADSFIEVPDEVAEAMTEFDRKEAAYRLRTYRHKAYYSLDREDGIEHSALFVSLSPCEIYERKVTMLSFTGKHRGLLLFSRLLSGISSLFILGPFLCVYFAAKELVAVFAGNGLDTQNVYSIPVFPGEGRIFWA